MTSRAGARLVVCSAFVIALSGWSHAPNRSANGFDPVSYTAISKDDYWVLGRVRCSGGRCFSILRTHDGGRSFASIPAPALPAPAGVVRTLQFVDRRNGYAFVTGLRGIFYATHDGGATWRRLALRTVLAFASGGGNAYAVTAQCSLQACLGHRFERSPVATNAWSGRPVPFALDSPGPELAARGSSVWLLGTPSGDLGAHGDKLARSTDGGRTFVVGRAPCYAGLGGELAPTSPSVVWAVCPTGMMAQAWRSTDGGVTFTHLRTPPLVNSAALAPASRHTAVLARNGARSRLLRTTDGGAHWKAVSTPGPAIYVSWIGFTNAKVGAALVQTSSGASANLQALWRTTDGGAHWFAVRVR